MVTAFIFLVPLAPYLTFHLVLPTPRASAGAAMPEVSQVFPFHPTSLSGAPVRPDAGGSPSPFSRAAVRKASRGWKWERMKMPGWKVLVTDRFVLQGDVKIDRLREVGACLEEFLRMMEASIGGDTTDRVFSARVFADRSNFLRYAASRGAANAESFYDPRTAELVLCPDDERGSEWLRKTLAHEFTHAYMDRVWNCTGPLWFAEGMAEYFAGFGVRDGRARPGDVDRRALLLVRLTDPTPLSRFLRMGREEMYGVAFPQHYAQAWSLVHYLFSRDDDVVDLLLRGKSLENVGEIEAKWKEYVKALK